jgi:hypothetical protein
MNVEQSNCAGGQFGATAESRYCEWPTWVSASRTRPARKAASVVIAVVLYLGVDKHLGGVENDLVCVLRNDVRDVVEIRHGFLLGCQPREYAAENR